MDALAWNVTSFSSSLGRMSMMGSSVPLATDAYEL